MTAGIIRGEWQRGGIRKVPKGDITEVECNSGGEGVSEKSQKEIS